MELQNRPLTEAEEAFQGVFVRALELFPQIAEAAREVIDTGGDCQYAFLSAFDDDADRAQAAAQWPLISMMLAGV